MFALARRTGIMSIRKQRWNRVLPLFALCALAVPPCAGKRESETMSVFEHKPDCVTAVSSIVDERGGEITVTDSASPIKDARVVFPPSAVSSAQTVSLGYCACPVKVRAGSVSSVALTLDVTGTRHFPVSVLIEISYDLRQSSEVVIPYRVDEKQRLQLVQIRRFDKSNHRLVFETAVPGTFVWVYP
jgi:hypothetical protein